MEEEVVEAAVPESSIEDSVALETNTLEEVDLEFETSDFETHFHEIDGDWRDVGLVQSFVDKYGDDFGIIAGFASMNAGGAGIAGAHHLGAFSGSQGAYFMIGSLMTVPFTAVFVKEYVDGRVENAEISSETDFEGEYRKVDDFDEVEKILESSDKVRYRNVTGLPHISDDSSPEEAARDYRDLIEALEEEQEYWEDVLDAEDFDRLTEKEQDILEAYEPGKDESELVDLKALENIQNLRDETLENLSDRLAESTINQYMRVKDIDHVSYEGTAYQLEVYQGRDLQFSVQGLTEDDLSSTGEQVDFIADIRP